MNPKARNFVLTFLLCFNSACSPANDPFVVSATPTIALASSKIASAITALPPTPSQQSANTLVLPPTEKAIISTKASACDQVSLPILDAFAFGGRLLLMTQSQNNQELWEITNNTQQIKSIGVPSANIGPRLRLSPDGNWILSTTTWNPLENESPREPLVIASDLSRAFTLEWNRDWDITLGWWDNTKIIVLPANGQTNEIVLLDVFTQSTSVFTQLALAVNRNYGNTFWSPWREKDGATVFFNNAFSQVLFFTPAGSLTLANVFESQPLWTYEQPNAFFSDNQDIARWSPNDEYVAFPAWDELFQDVYLLSKTGSVKQVTDFSKSGKPNMFVRLLDWSPDGTKLAFTARSTIETQTSSPLFIFDLTLGEIQELCLGISDSAWSPDSRYLSAVIVNQEAPDQSQLIVIDVKSSEKWFIAENDKPLSIVGWSKSP